MYFRSTLWCLLLVMSVHVMRAGSAFAQDTAKPVVEAHSTNTPGCLLVVWMHATSGVHHFELLRDDGRQPIVFESRNSHTECGLQPNTAYRYQVCTHFISSDGDVACSEWTPAVRTNAAEPPANKPGAPPTPRVVEHHAGDTWIGVKWDAGSTYHKYFVNITHVTASGEWVKVARTIEHNDDGTWGYQRVDGLDPGETYAFKVQGCTKSLLGLAEDNCWGWSQPYTASTVAPPPIDPRSCISGFVWREATLGDLVCVTPEVRAQARRDNQLAPQRRIGPPIFVPDKCPLNNPKSRQCYAFNVPCKSGFVWRASTPTDYVCVPPATRDQTWTDNAQERARRVGK